jgi:hypothetical protein
MYHLVPLLPSVFFQGIGRNLKFTQGNGDEQKHTQRDERAEPLRPTFKLNHVGMN